MKHTQSNEVKYNAYDSVFADLFSTKEHQLELYKALLGDKARKDIKPEDINLINIEKLFFNDLYNDLSFVVDNELMILVEAQSTYTKNIVTRLLFYVSKVLEEYIRSLSSDNKLNSLYNEKEVKIPTIKLYTIYTGKKQVKDHYINLKELVEDTGIESDIDLKVKVISIPDNDNILGQYMTLCKVLREQLKKHKDDSKAISETIRICKNEDILREYLAKKEHEVIEMLAHLVTSEDWVEYRFNEGIEIGKAEGIKLGKAEGIKLGESRGIVIGLLMAGLPDEEVMKKANITESELKKYKEELSK